jgi:hypothetical protein
MTPRTRSETLRTLLFLLVFLLATATVSAMDLMTKSAASPWQYLYFDGREFRSAADPAAATLRSRDGYLPVTGQTGAQHLEPLPSDSGAVVVFCFIQTSGGKLSGTSGFLPQPGIPLEIVGEGHRRAGETGTEGFFVAALPAGSYTLLIAGSRQPVQVEQGKTRIISSRTGKRMVD